ncbi:ATP-binding cassette domain-containing protein [Bacillus licheniformis]|nr:ATP-binding cassette domain-containing protein [Bacillus licheniformis]
MLGESGSGKSLTASAIAGLLPDGLTVTGGDVIFEGQQMLQAGRKALRRVRGKDIACIFRTVTEHSPLYTDRQTN